MAGLEYFAPKKKSHEVASHFRELRPSWPFIAIFYGFPLLSGGKSLMD